MEDNILFDNYHDKGVYVHYDLNNHKNGMKIKEMDVDELFSLIFNHIKQNKELNFEN